MLVVRKRFTYAYHVFVYGMYKADDDAGVLALMNGMTIDEKIDLSSLDFKLMWFKIKLGVVGNTSAYFRARGKYETAFVCDGGRRLRKLLTKSTHGTMNWEIPRGRKKDKFELDLHCAVREFREETGVAKEKYRLFPASRIQITEDAGVRYVVKYYFAFAENIEEIRLKFDDPGGIGEISDVKWMPMSGLLELSPALGMFAKSTFNYVRKRIKA